MKTCYTKRAFGQVMNYIRHTILILILFIPVVLYATSEMTAEQMDEVDIPQTVEELPDVVLENEVSQLKENPVREEIQRVFGSNWELAYAVMMSESSGRVKVTNTNTDMHNSIDRGLFQINSYWHPDVSIECAFDMVCNIQEAYRISNGGTNWQPWYGYTHGHYRKFL